MEKRIRLNTLKICGAGKHISVLAFMCYSEAKAIFGHILPAFVHVSSSCSQINEQLKTGFVPVPGSY